MEKTHFEQSAGGFVFCQKGNQWYVALLKSDKGRILTPKGLIDPDETEEAAAEREIREELGLHSDISPLGKIGESAYSYNFEGRKHWKKVHLFLFMSEEMIDLKPQEEEGFVGAEWLPIEEALKIITFDKKYLAEASTKVHGT